VIGIAQSESGAEFSDDMRYRYTLWRRWEPYPCRIVAFCGLNPSTADEVDPDPTVTREINFAKSWGYGGYIKVNLFAWRDTDPAGMLAAAEPIGELNDRAIDESARMSDLFVCAWGADGVHRNRCNVVESRLRRGGIELHMLRLTKHGHPGHPLYLPKSLVPIRWERQLC